MSTSEQQMSDQERPSVHPLCCYELDFNHSKHEVKVVKYQMCNRSALLFYFFYLPINLFIYLFLWGCEGRGGERRSGVALWKAWKWTAQLQPHTGGGKVPTEDSISSIQS